MRRCRCRRLVRRIRKRRSVRRSLHRRERTFNFDKTADTWWSTVLLETNSERAISALRRPCASRSKTCSSRLVRLCGLLRVLSFAPRGIRRAAWTRSRRRVAATMGPALLKLGERRAQLTRFAALAPASVSELNSSVPELNQERSEP